MQTHFTCIHYFLSENIDFLKEKKKQDVQNKIADIKTQT